MTLRTVETDTAFVDIKTDIALFDWSATRMRADPKQRYYPKILVDMANFLLLHLPNGLTERDLVKAFDPGRLNKAFDLPPGSLLGALFQLTADTGEQDMASESLIEFMALLLPDLMDEPPSLNTVNLRAIEALGLWEAGAFRLALRDGRPWLVTTKAGQAAMNIKVAVEYRREMQDDE